MNNSLPVNVCRMFAVAVFAAFVASVCAATPPDLILHNGKVLTIDKDFSIQQAVAIRGDKLQAVGASAEVLAMRGPDTRLVDLQGKTVLPGLIDSHVHPVAASLTEFDHPIPAMDTIADVLNYVRARADALDDGEWIEVSQVFITRLREQRYPTRAELDKAAPRNPVVFFTSPDAVLNTLALNKSGIDKDFRVSGRGFVEKDPVTGEPTGMLRSCARYVKSVSPRRKPTEAERLSRLEELFADYNSVGLTCVADRSGNAANNRLYRQLLSDERLTVRVRVSTKVDIDGAVPEIQQSIRAVAADPLRKGGPMLQVIGIKIFLDGGMLTGSAYLREPWGTSAIYSIADPAYRGVLFLPPESLLPIVQTAAEEGLQFTAHSVGDGAVHTLLDAYEKVSRTLPLKRPCITHSNFMSREAIDQAARLGVVLDIQPAWLYLDARTLSVQFGEKRLRYFQPLKSLFAAGVVAGVGSDHMQKIGAARAINPYNPFHGMWTTIAREGRWFEGQLHPEESLSREQALQLYTINNARLLFLEEQVGSLEEGKLADLVVVDRDVLTCPLADLQATQVLQTYLNGRQVYPRTP